MSGLTVFGFEPDFLGLPQLLAFQQITIHLGQANGCVFALEGQTKHITGLVKIAAHPNGNVNVRGYRTQTKDFLTAAASFKRSFARHRKKTDVASILRREINLASI